MEYNVIEEEKKIILKDIKSFDPEHIFECGQAFRWYKNEDGSYTTIAYNRVINVLKTGDDIHIDNTNMDDFKNIWYHYFDLSTDYEEIKKILSKDDNILKDATEFGKGIRILNQEPFETIISFIISANNQIPRIRKSIEIIAKEYGDFIENYNGTDYFSFPTAEKLAKVDVLDLREKARVGFRDKRIIDTSNMIANNEIDIEEIFSLSRNEGKEKLMELPGVGPKVSDCILLFAYDKSDAFPVDVWVKRVMEYFYLKEETSLKNISKQGDLLFKDLAGYAQQYLFYYARELDIGK